jgi:hypothetical protein
MHLLIVSLLSLSTFFVNPPQQPAWSDYSSTEGQFSAALPTDRQVGMIVTETGKGPVYTHTVSATDKDRNEYQVSWTSYAQSVEARGNEQTFDRVRDALIASKGGKLFSESALNLMGRPARSIIFTDSDGRIIRVRFYFIGTRFYQVMVQNGSKQDSADSERFFQSFKVSVR